MKIFSPLEQFEINILQPLRFFGFDFSLTNSAVYSVLIFLSLYVLFYLGVSKPFLIPGRWQVVSESFYSFILDMWLNNKLVLRLINFFLCCLLRLWLF